MGERSKMLGLIDGSIGVGCGLLFLDGSVTQWAAHANEVGLCMFVFASVVALSQPRQTWVEVPCLSWARGAVAFSSPPRILPASCEQLLC